MPSGVSNLMLEFQLPFSSLQKLEMVGTDKVWFYDMKADGLSLDDKRQPISDNDIPDIIQRFHQLDNEAERKRTDQSFFVSSR